MIMATTLLVRGSNPVWSFVDLTAHQFDDTFYMWVLQNDIPYFPATVWHDPNANVPWTQPIQFFANGTLPIDIFWDSTATYRLEFRQHLDPLTAPTQADPLIYLVENYKPGSGGSSPIDGGAIITDNQIANPQFSEISFTSPYSVIGATDLELEVAPGWTLSLAGTGNLALERVPLNSTLTNPTNAPYALRITILGWTSGGVKLRQRFQQAGMLWASTPGHTRYVSSSVTARVEGDPAFISARLVDSMGAPLTEVLESTLITSAFNEFNDFGQMPLTTNTNTPPAAYIDYEMLLPSTVDIYLTSFQLIQSEIATSFEYEQDSIDRQIDHLFHYWKPPLDFKPIPSYLTAWDFPLNPCQFVDVWVDNVVLPKATGANTSYYAWDQTIVFQTANNGVTVQRNAQNDAITLFASAVTQVAIIQYLTGHQARKLFQNLLLDGASVQVRCDSGTIRNMTLSLWWSDNAALPNISAGTSLVSTLDANGHPATVAAGWHEIKRRNIGESNLFTNTAINQIETFDFAYFLDSAPWLATATQFAIVIGTASMQIGEFVLFDYVSLVPGAIPTQPAPQTPDEVLRECQRYYIKSFLPEVVPAQAAGLGSGPSLVTQATGGAFATNGPIVRFATPMWKTPAITLYNPINANAQITTFGVGDWTNSASSATEAGILFAGTANAGSAAGNLALINWTANALLGTP